MNVNSLAQDMNVSSYKHGAYQMLDAWRGLASLFVVLCHASATITARDTDLVVEPLYRFSTFGYLGVQIFFVISGYCIANSASSALRKRSGWKAFIVARGRRIFPPCWFSLILLAAFSLLAQFLVSTGRLHGSALAGRDILHQSVLYYLANLTLTQTLLHQPYFSIVCWTLSYEVAFYLIVSLILVGALRSCTEETLLTGLHLLTLTTLTSLILSPDRCYYPFDLWPQFGFGVLVYDILKHPKQIRPKRWLLGIGLVTLVFVLCRNTRIGPLQEPSRLTFVVASVFTVLLLFLYRYDIALTRFGPIRWLMMLGIFSYSLYLTHYLTIGAVDQAFKLLKLGTSTHLLLLLACLIGSVLVAWVFFHLCERPFMGSTKRPVPESVTTAAALEVS